MRDNNIECYIYKAILEEHRHATTNVKKIRRGACFTFEFLVSIPDSIMDYTMENDHDI
ncbi:MAG: hypothetical protein OQL19_13310 [Gammaproteobacteria bacterium]|nr:hypothetical protein [Gammaproteobacteria bacterium]